MLAQIAVWDWYKAKHRRLLASVRAFLPGEDVEDVALAQRWTSTWPGLVGLGVVAAAAVLDGDRLWITVVGLGLGFALLLVGWLTIPATLLVTTRDQVIVIAARRRTYQPVVIEERIARAQWRTSEQLRERRLWVGAAWKRHLP